MKYTVEMASADMKYIPYFMMISSGIHVILRFLRQQLERLQCWYYWWGRFMNYTVNMASGSTTDMQSFMTTDAGI
jgi:hypothetical protein